MWKAYYNASDLVGALKVLEENSGKARIIAGGTDLLLELEKSDTSDLTLIDISRIDGLDEIKLDSDGFVHLGPLVTHNQCVNSKLLREYAFPLVMASYSVGSPQIRNRGTIAGNIITASPANDTISPLMALDAALTLKSLRGSRQVYLKDFYTGVRKTVKQPDEILVDIAFKGMEIKQKGIFQKFALRKAQAISLLNATCILTFNGTSIIQAVITLGSVAPTIIHAAQAEKYLVGKSLVDDVIREASVIAASEIKPIDDIRGSALYRKDMARVTVMRALKELAEGNVDRLIPDRPALLWGKNLNDEKKSRTNTKLFETATNIETFINGKTYCIGGAAEKSLLRFIREDVGLTGTKEGCAEGECGACTVILDGKAVMSCLIPAPRADGAEIKTIEGLRSNGQLSPVQQAFLDEGAVQCGYCTPGFVISATQLIDEIETPTRDEITAAISGNLCRCTGYYKIIRAIEKASMK